MFKIVVTTSGRWNFFPGCYCYIIARPNMLQGHPFSIYVAPDNTSTPGNAQLTMVVKPRKGKTSRLTRMLQENYEITGSRSMQTMLLIDGPYGSQQPLAEYTNILLISGGVGVTAAYGYASYISGLQRSTFWTTRAHKIIFVWIVHDARSLKWFQSEILHLIKAPNVKVEIYITRGFLDKDQTKDALVSSTRVYQASQLERWVLRGSPTAPMISRTVPIETIEAVKSDDEKISKPSQDTNYFDTMDTPLPRLSAGSTLTSRGSPMLSAFPPPSDDDDGSARSFDPNGTARTLDPNVLTGQMKDTEKGKQSETPREGAIGENWIKPESEASAPAGRQAGTASSESSNHSNPGKHPTSEEGISGDPGSRQGSSSADDYDIPETGKFKIEMIKPNVGQLLAHHFSEISEDSVGVFVCGPENFNDEVRAAFVSETGIRGNIRMDYFEESFC